MHEFQVFWESTRGYIQVVTHLATTPIRPGLTWNSVVKGNAITTSAIRRCIYADIQTWAEYESLSPCTYPHGGG